MSRTSNVVTLPLIFTLAAVAFGPRLYLEGKARVGPIAELAGAEKAGNAGETVPVSPDATAIPGPRPPG